MKVSIGTSQPITLTSDLVIGQGGEAIIYKDPDSPDALALKIYRTPNAQRANKLEAMLRTKLALPPSAIMPQEAVRTDTGELVGFRMRRLTNRYRKIGLIFGDKFSRTHGFIPKTKTSLFMEMRRDLANIHAGKIVIGDLNDGNIMVDEVGHGLVWIDMDSVQFDSYPCVAGTLLYLSPDLYGIDLSQKAVFKPEHDWFSFAVLLTRALTNGVHPFKSGLHAKYTSILDRATHGATVFDADVTWPSVGLPPEVLSDELIAILQKTLKREVRSAFPHEVLEQYRQSLIECTSCGVSYPARRAKCPSCAKTTVLDAQATAVVAGFSIETLVHTSGRVLYTARIGSRIVAVTSEGATHFVYAKDGGANVTKRSLPPGIPAGARFGSFGESIVVCADPSQELADLHVLDLTPHGVTKRTRLTTSAFAGGRAVFATSDRFIYRIAGRELLCGERFGSSDVLERPVMQIREGQTWFTVGRNLGPNLELIAGFHREFGDAHWFIVRGSGDGRTFVRFEDLPVQPLDPRETVTDHAVYFSREAVMLVRATRKTGVDRVRVDIISTVDGSILKTLLMVGSDIGPWERVRGKAFFSGLVMHATDQGIVREKLADRSRNSLLFTAPHVQSLDDLDRLGDGILVMKTDRVLLIKP